MSNKKADISQIRKYLEGELDTRAMHQLERQAQDDPFLMEAIEGFEQSGKDQHANLADLENRLQARTEKKKVRPLWPYIGAAASLLVAITIGYLLWPHNSPEKMPAEKRFAAQIDHPQVKVDTVIPPVVNHQELVAATPVPTQTYRQATVKAAVQAPVPAGQEEAQQEMVQPSDEQTPAGSPLAEDKAGPGENSLFKKEAKSSYGYVNQATIQNSYTQAHRADTAALMLKEVVVPGRNQPKKNINTAVNTAVPGSVEGVKTVTPEFRVNGRVYDELGVPLPGVSVTNAITRISAVTDVEGRFTLPAKDGQTLDISYIGYAQKHVKAKDSLRVALEASNNSLAEVVVVGYGGVKSEEPDNSAHPKTGWDNYNSYLKKLAIAPNGQTGAVRISFTVNSNGGLDNFKILKSLNASADQMAIELVKNGPAWQPDASGKAKTIRLRIHFNKK
ncbi:TonB family protein [Mucilaginibacter yixingensis]|uniref:TonB family protein n=1 Tax=Mucilaginibacter yixingensis TaxID=1295612 RepID=A0A2T5J8E9_9SPHI|nr:energy transducer TonB [Mucilaginibacter yixingensis]PTQ95664.1 TonB family protein [Mucilaginibacter yixingensis]